MIVVGRDWMRAPVSFMVSNDGVTFNDLLDADGNEVNMMAVPGSTLSIPQEHTREARFLKIRSGTSYAPVRQTADCVITLAAT
jgi:hypothetical protein